MARTDPKESRPKAPAGGLLELAAGLYVYQEGDRGTEMYVIERGEVEILKRWGGEERRLLLLKQGDFFGEESVVAQLPRATSVRVVSDCRLLPVDETVLREMLDQGAGVGMRLIQGLSRRQREALRLVPGVAAPSIETRRVTPEEVEPPTVDLAPGSGKLVHSPSGVEFEFGGMEVVRIGRHDAVSGTDPDIDLSSLDSEHSLSRSHAQISRRGGRYFVSDEVGSANGTYVNGRRVEKGSPVEIKDGDEIRFGLIKTHFRAAG